MKKGFTLIELLAVIVILAIIALIATPIVLSVIKDSKESTTLISAEYYLKAVEQTIAKKSLEDGSNYRPKECEINSDGNLLCDNKEILEVDVKGNKPSDGRIIFEKGKTTNITLEIDNKTILKNDKGDLVVGELLTEYIRNLFKETTTVKVNNIEYSLDEKHLLMNDRLGSNDVDKLEGNIRYYGKSPNNYIDIGDRDSDGNIIFWRIIGLFKDMEVTDEEGNAIKKEDLVKIIRADKLTLGDIDGFSYDYTELGEYDNNWHDSTLQMMLNNAYYNSETTNYYNNSTTPVELNFRGEGLSSKVHNKVERVNWSLGGHSDTQIFVDEMYKYERAGTNKWTGKIALMYASDYGYLSDLGSCQSILRSYNSSTCTTANWMYDSTKHQWTLTPDSLYSTTAFYINYNGYVGYSGACLDAVFRPVLYLNSDVGIVEEKETSDGLKYFVVE